MGASKLMLLEHIVAKNTCKSTFQIHTKPDLCQINKLHACVLINIEIYFVLVIN